MIELDDVTIHSGSFRLSGLRLAVATGTYGVLMGATGLGKTTILEAICGLRPVSQGRILLGGIDVTGLHPAARGIGYVPQDLALFPTMTVRDHLAFSLRLRRIGREAIEARCREVAGMLGISHLLDRRPQGLSGGESQRVAIGRAFAFEPAVLLLDEPFTSLDEDTAAGLCRLVKAVQSRTGVTVLHVTHNRSEALRLADRCFHLSADRLVELPREALDPDRRPFCPPASPEESPPCSSPSV